MTRLFFGMVAIAALLPGCASVKYAKVPKGEIGGRLTIEWVAADRFVYRPDPQKPFYFKRANGEVIRPKKMFTDGGSIPRPLWALRGYSPWGFGPAYLAHDWLFDAHHCNLPEAKDHTVFTAADVLAEVMKTLMEADKPQVVKSAGLLDSIDAAVRTPIAQNLWNTGKCEEPPPEMFSRSLFRARGGGGFVESYDLDALKH